MIPTQHDAAYGTGFSWRGNVSDTTGHFLHWVDITGGVAVVGDATGRIKARIWKQVDAGSEEVYYYGVEGRKLGTYIVSMDAQGQPNGFYEGSRSLYFGGKLIAAEGKGVMVDRLGSVRVADAGYPSQTIWTKSAYWAYGEERTAETANGRVKFATYFRDGESGLDHADQRYYDPGSGRFLTADPYRASGGAGEPGSWNRYAYVGGDPQNGIDPAGLDMCKLNGEEVFQAGCLSVLLSSWVHSLAPYVTVAGYDDVHGTGKKTSPRDIVIDAVMRSSDRLFAEDCAGLFLRPDANTIAQRQLLSGHLQMLADTKSVRTISAASLPSGTPEGVGGFTTGTLGLIYFIQGRSFFTGQLNGKPLGGALEGLTLSQVQELEVIHEHLHYWGIGPDDAGQAYIMANGDRVVGSEGISREVRKKCFN